MGVRLAMSAPKETSMSIGSARIAGWLHHRVSPANGWRQQPRRKWDATRCLSIAAADGADHTIAFASGGAAG